ncbi:MAG: OmpA family protein [Opitutae bacterium]|nr:OmpA family protein [Opitutae bacterium]
MKNFAKLLGLTLALSALIFSGCKKKPVRDASTLPATGSSSTIDPNAVALTEDPNTTLAPRTEDKPVNENQSVVDAVYFALDRAAVAAPERPKLDAALKWLGANPEKSLVLVGHCDWRGTAEYNLGLGDRRANAVKRYLESLGADPKRLETLSKGSTDAKQAGGEAEWQKDRRVDFVELKRQ